MSTLWFSHPDCLSHSPPPGHPERVERLEAIERGLGPLGLERRSAPLADEAEVLRCHPQRVIDSLRAAEPATGTVQIETDTWLSPGSVAAALRAIGGVEAAVDAVMAGEAANAFVGCRPPGHHAEREKPMGFCLFGTIAIAARYAMARHGVTRVAVVDFDVHHGNGTQDLLWDETRVLFCSSHQMPLYPGTGAVDERGAHGNVVNVPLAPGTGGAEMRAAYERTILPAIDAFQPRLILVSAGFDAHAADPLAQLDWEREDFVWLTDRICDLADRHAGGRVVSTLEGGYDLDALAASAAAHVGRLKDRGG